MQLDVSQQQQPLRLPQPGQCRRQVQLVELSKKAMGKQVSAQTQAPFKLTCQSLKLADFLQISAAYFLVNENPTRVSVCIVYPQSVLEYMVKAEQSIMAVRSLI